MIVLFVWYNTPSNLIGILTMRLEEPSESEIAELKADLVDHIFSFEDLMLISLAPYFKETPLKLNILYRDEQQVRFIILFRVPKRVKTMEARFDILTDSVHLSVNKSNVDLVNMNNHYQTVLHSVKKLTFDYRLCAEFNIGRRAANIENLERFLMQTTYVELPNFTKKESPVSVIKTRLDLKSDASLTLLTVYDNTTKKADTSLEYRRYKKNRYIDIDVKLKPSLYDTFEGLAFRLFFNQHYSIHKTERTIDFVRMIRF